MKEAWISLGGVDMHLYLQLQRLVWSPMNIVKVGVG